MFCFSLLLCSITANVGEIVNFCCLLIFYLAGFSLKLDFEMSHFRKAKLYNSLNFPETITTFMRKPF